MSHLYGTALAFARRGTSDHEATVTAPLRETEHRILIVDDEQPVRDAIREYLTAYGYGVDGAQELEEAEALLATTDYSLMLVDIRLTGLHGREGLELLRFARRHCPEIRLIVMTAHASDGLELDARRRGADAFLEKPLPLSRLLVEVHKLLRGTDSLVNLWGRDG